MKYANRILIRAFCHPEEDAGQTRKAFHALLGCSKEEAEREKIRVSETKAKGFRDRTILVLEAELEKERHTNRFIKELSEKLRDADKELLVSQVNRIDDDVNFYVRLDKNALIEGRYEVTDSGDCFHIRMSLSCYPKRRDIAHKAVEKMLGFS